MGEGRDRITTDPARLEQLERIANSLENIERLLWTLKEQNDE